jgi:chemotaxis family two-component system sensor kinase Cph1
MAELGRWMMTQPACQPGASDPIFQTDHLPELYPAAKDFAIIASGVVGFCFSRSPLGLILYFRPETIRTLTWAGNPYELPLAAGPNGPRLSPRKSFELWRETVSQRSLPWKKIEIESVLKLRSLVSDIAERKQREDELRADLKERVRVNQALAAAKLELGLQLGKKGKLADELAVINTELTHSNDALERSNVELGQFAYVASHDLQTPLRNINGFVQLLKANYAGKLDAKAEGWMNRIVESSGQMHTLIQDVLTYSRVDSRARPFELVSLRDVYNDSVQLLQASIDDAGGAVSCGELPAVMGDRSQLVQLMQNLIGNGLKYHGEKPPHIHVSAELNGSNWLFSVRDNGIGIAPKHLERIFEIFKRLHDQKEYPGTGIGLAVCRRVVHRHGGKIWAESAGDGQGSTFKFTIPAEKN